jgi:hypothetical protein
MENNFIPYLDTKVYLRDGKFNLSFYQKPTKSDILQNYNESVNPKNQKLSLLSGEIYRVNNTCTTQKDLDEGLKKLKSKFVKNSYPPKLVNSKIEEMTANNFKTPPKNKEDIEMTHYFSADFTSRRCYKIGVTMKSLISKVTPKFDLIIAWKTIRLKSIIFQRLKKSIPVEEKSGLVYKWCCPCGSEYYGETSRPLQTRAEEHTKPDTVKVKNKSAIYLHFNQCDEFKEAYQKVLNSAPNTGKIKKDTFAMQHFSIVETRLTNYWDRKISELFLIKLNNPRLNVQTSSADVDFLK